MEACVLLKSTILRRHRAWSVESSIGPLASLRITRVRAASAYPRIAWLCLSRYSGSSENRTAVAKIPKRTSGSLVPRVEMKVVGSKSGRG